MQLFFLSNDHDFDKHVFAFSESRAIGIYFTHYAFNDVKPHNFWVRSVTPEEIVEPDRSHLREALTWEVEGIGLYDAVKGWTIVPPYDESEVEDE